MTKNLTQLTRTEIDWSLAKEIFADLLETPFPERKDMLDRKVGHDRKLHQVVNRLMAAHTNASEFLDDTEGNGAAD